MRLAGASAVNNNQNQPSSTNNILGDWSFDYFLTEDGRLRLNAAYYDYTFDGYQTKWDNVSARVYSAAGPGLVQQVQGGIFNNNDASNSDNLIDA